ncbi:Gas vesicle synthesis protein GvpO [Sinosporangium album]|uniref:Gas vesicle synthesis protein GvpO n=1 Tax=Sinosporangium album TaxID=504805 RepID=A0A1G8C7X2_9ACTN|nr:gas vesicle protein GvpO [Sinosporangium album]SDH40970.1 Gas vesicle synthesis protein GvpO [Sinosporangium album]
MAERRRLRDDDEYRDDYRDSRDDSRDDVRERRPRGGRPHTLSAGEAGGAGLRHITGLTGREAEGVTLVKPVEDGWIVDVEVVEDRRIPSSGDILALYEAELDAEGDLESYRRLRRYRRGSGDIDGTSR